MADGKSGLFDLSGKVAWVIGGAGYLGRPICEGLAAHGATVVIADRRRPPADEVASAIQQAGGRAEACELDVVDEQAVIAAFDGGLDRLKRLDILVNVTHGSTGKPMDQMSLADWEVGTRISLGGAFVLAREAARIMTAQEIGRAHV